MIEMLKSLRPHVRVLIAFFIIISWAIAYLAIKKGLANSEVDKAVQEKQGIYQILDTLQYNEAIYDSMRSFFNSDSTTYTALTSDKSEIVKLRGLIKTPYHERQSIAKESEIKVIILLYQFVKTAREGDEQAERVNNLKDLLEATDVDTANVDSGNE